MKKWWLGAALAAMVVSQSARAQYPPDGGGLLPEPAPVAPSGGQGDGPTFMPGPLSPSMAPPGPDAEMSLPADIPTAWGKGPPPDEGVYFSIGTQSLDRQQPGHGGIAVTTDGNMPVLNSNQIEPVYRWGPLVTVGYLFDNAALELTGYYLAPQEIVTKATVTNGLTVPFYAAPAGFTSEGVNVWTGASGVKLALQDTIGNAELNYRWWSRALTGVEGLVGLRYMNLQERATIETNDPAAAPLFNNDFNLTFSRYMARVNNNLYMPQTGIDFVLPIRPWLSVGLLAKTGFGADDVQLTTRLSNGDASVVVQGRKSEWTYTSLNEVNAYINIVAWDKVRLRLGYTAMWLWHVSEGFSQVDYNLSTNPPAIHDNGNIFFHGPRLEVEFLF